MDISLKIAADFSQAQKSFSDLASSSEDMRKKMETANAKGFSTDQIKKFNDQQKITQSAMAATRGESCSLASSAGAYKNKIEQLIKSGLSPESDAVKQLQAEYTTLKQKMEDNKLAADGQQQMCKAAEKALLGVVAAGAALGAGLVKASMDMAKAGDEAAKTGRLVGMSAESFQTLDYAAKANNIGNLGGVLKKMNTSMGQVANGTGNLTKYLKENDTALLSQLKTCKNSEESFLTMMDALSKETDTVKRAELAQAAFGKSGQDMLTMCENGTEGIQALREEAEKYGIISNESCAASEAFMDAQTRLQKATEGVRNELGSILLPVLSKAIDGITNFVSNISNWEGIIKTAVVVLASLTAGLSAFLLVTKAAPMVSAMTQTIKAMSLAMQANPVGIIVGALAMLIPLIILAIKNFDQIKIEVETFALKAGNAVQQFGSKMKEVFLVAINSIQNAFISLGRMIAEGVLGKVEALLNLLGNIPGIGDSFKNAAASVASFKDGLTASAEAAIEANNAEIEAAKTAREAAKAELEQKLADIETEAQAKRDALRAMQEDADSMLENNQERMAQILEQDAELAEAKLEADQALADKRLEIKQKSEADLLEEARKAAEEEERLQESKLDAYSNIMGKMGDIVAGAGEKNKAALIASKGIAIAEIGVSTARAVMKAAAEFPVEPFKSINIASVLATSIAQVAAVGKAIASAETGGRFIVPNSPGVDTTTMKVNAGEEISVVPRGMAGSGSENTNIYLNVDGSVFASIMNKCIKRGEVNKMFFAGGY